MDVIDSYFAKELCGEECEVVSNLIAASRMGSLCLEVDGELPMELIGENKPLYLDGNRLYLQKNWEIESTIVEEVRRLVRRKCDRIAYELEEGLNVEQKEAVEKALSHSISIITGGPGTGKSFTAVAIAKKVGKVVVAAPTGKAAAHLEMKLDMECKVGTLHSLIDDLDADLLIVDECSMIDAKMFAKLLSRIGENTRVVLMGDSNQLASVEQGAVFADLVESGVIPTTRLHKSMRCEEGGILKVIRQIERGEEIDLEYKDDSFEWIEKSDADRVIKEAIDRYYTSEEKLGGFRILSCLRRSMLGLEKMNEKIYRYLVEKRKDFIAIPIIVTKSDKARKLYNGMTGVLYRFFDQREEYACFGERKESVLPEYEYAYCLSVHKSQGSEYDEVLLLVPDGTDVFGREILYTGMTRARKSLKIIGDAEVIQGIATKKISRVSGLKNRLLCEL